MKTNLLFPVYLAVGIVAGCSNEPSSRVSSTTPVSSARTAVVKNEPPASDHAVTQFSLPASRPITARPDTGTKVAPSPSGHSHAGHEQHHSTASRDRGRKRPPAASAGPVDLASTIVDPATFENAEVRDTYAKAKQIPERLDGMYCYCRCKENEQLAHKSLLTCFQDDHAAQCGICLKEAQQAFLDFQDDIPLEITKKSIDILYNQGNPPPQ
ncbi:MAG TPA: PCYCGC motif-containing (lipo)protein [Thermoanaerobaculia bacterium]|nr:PCYCGC motif-containing (lipo)protein [Thermoanaerobaculia bacterium]